MNLLSPSFLLHNADKLGWEYKKGLLPSLYLTACPCVMTVIVSVQKTGSVLVKVFKKHIWVTVIQASLYCVFTLSHMRV